VYSIPIRREYCDSARDGTTAIGNWQRSVGGIGTIVNVLKGLLKLVMVGAGEGGDGTESSERIIAVVGSYPLSSDDWRLNILSGLEVSLIFP
jgi:hypothetical protein